MAKVKKEEAKKFLANVDPSQVFWLPDGSSLKNIKELVRSLKKMSDDVFKHHVNKNKNDFANWIKDVIGDTAFAARLYKNKTKKAVLKAVSERVEALKKAVKPNAIVKKTTKVKKTVKK